MDLQDDALRVLRASQALTRSRRNVSVASVLGVLLTNEHTEKSSRQERVARTSPFEVRATC
jgi:hypothetical protein